MLHCLRNASFHWIKSWRFLHQPWNVTSYVPIIKRWISEIYFWDFHSVIGWLIDWIEFSAIFSHLTAIHIVKRAKRADPEDIYSMDKNIVHVYFTIENLLKRSTLHTLNILIANVMQTCLHIMQWSICCGSLGYFCFYFN